MRSAIATRSTFSVVAPYVSVGAALFCIQLDFFALNLALPMIGATFDLPATELQWLISGYMIAFGSLMIPAGRSADFLGRRRVLQCGIAVFGFSSLMCGLAPVPAILIVGRVLQGVGAALVMPSALALVTNATKERERPRIVGALLGIAGVGTALGPVAGGVFATWIGWRWVFLVNVPAAVYAMWRCRTLSNSRDPGVPASPASIDGWGTATVVLGLALLSVAIDNVSGDGWIRAATLVPLLLGVLALVGFRFVERRARSPLVRFDLFRNRVFVVLMVAGGAANIGACVCVVSATINLQSIRGFTAAQSGLLFLLSSPGIACCGPLSGRLTVRFRPTMVMVVALLLSVPALIWLAVAGDLWLYSLALGACGITTGMGFALGQLAVQNVLPPSRSAEGTSVLMTALICSGGVGVVAATSAMSSIGGGTPTAHSILVVMVGLAVLLLVVAVLTLVVVRRRP